ncbi:type II secretion system F family protein [Phenylobacterium sp.]|jgi:tight adherence protein C|uniref:type II secretion system F family protein n=1 Tax=Phenylobacterium sp. TaxID=1871053 RepID=UPI0035B459C6
MVETLTNPDNLLAAFVAVVCFATIVTIAMPMLHRNNLEARLKSVSTRREELRRKSREALAKRGAGTSLRHVDEGLYKKVVDRLQLSRLLEDPQVVDKLAQAGYRGPRPVSTFYFFRFVLPFVFAALTAMYLFFIDGFGMPTMTRIALSVGGLTAGYYAPNLYITNMAQKRRESIVGAFPDALDLLLICVESGMSIEAAIQKVSQEMGGASIELAEELTLLTAEISYLPERRLAYEGLARRTNHPGIKSVMTAMIQAERYGTPLGAALRVMAKENRDMRLAAAEKKAAQLPAKLTVPMIVFFLPVLFIVILGPAGLRVYDMMSASSVGG